MAPSQDYYGELGVSRKASDKEIKQAYRRLARKYHPDVNPGDRAAEARFKAVNEAYEVLSDPEKRRKYDQFGKNWRQADAFRRAGATASSSRPGGSRGFDFGRSRTSGNDSGGFSDIFESIFGGRSGSRNARMRGDDVEQPVEISLEEAFTGTTRLIEKAVPTNGKLRRLEIKIPAGVKDGDRIRVAGEGGVGPAGNGDLFLVVRLMPHAQFERKGDDLYTEVSVPLTVAMLGGEVAVSLPKGKVLLRIPPETQNGRTFRLTGKGMPRRGTDAKGDLYAKVKVVLPTRLTEREKALFEELRKHRGE